MTLTNILAFACGSLVGTMICSLVYMRSMSKVARVIHYVRRNAYLRGWRDGNEVAWKADA